MNKELIEQIRNGKALHYDIDNVELLNVVIKEVYPLKGQLFGYYEYYYLENDKVECSDSTTRDTIPLSSFLDQPKMISVEAVNTELDRLIDLCEKQEKAFKECSMENSQMCTNAMLTAYKVVKQFITDSTHTNVK